MRRHAITALGLLASALPAAAHAQTTASVVSFDHTNIQRNGSPRVQEVLGGGAVPITQPIGLRDCPCETWTFHVNTGAFTWTQPRLEFWIGTDSMACFNQSTRYPGSVSPTCWQIPDLPGIQTVFPNAASNFMYVVTIPSVLLVNPLNRTCSPLNSGNSAGSVYLSVLARGSPSDNMGTPGDSIQIQYIVSPPDQPTGVTAAPQDRSALVQWNAAGAVGTVGSETDEAGTPIGSTSSLLGYYVLCFPTAPPSFDAGSFDACADQIDVGTGVGIDAIDTGFDAGVTDTGTDVDTDASTEAGSDGATVTDAAVTETEGTDASTACGTLPAGFDPNDDQQFNRYVCSPLQTVSSASYSVQGLVNGQNYWFAVVAEDTAGNRSVSDVSPCIMPQPVTDFWQHYHDAGGRAQPGFCAVRPGPVRWRGIVPVAFGVVAAGALARRARRRRSKRGVQ